jgi:tetratricopeptide (TPR) repeat protein
MGRSPPGKPLAAACFLGLALSLLLAGGLFFIVKYSGRTLFPPKKAGEESGFYRKLRDYDGSAARMAASPESADPGRLLHMLDGLEKEALGVETRLSVLKRRRALASEFSAPAAGADPFLVSYRDAALREAAAFPFSQPLAAAAAEALIRSAAEGGNGGLRAAAETARDYGALLAEPSLLPLSMAVFILAGDMGDPGRAAAIPRGRERLEAFTEADGAASGGEALAADGAILALLRGDIREAGTQIRTLLKPRDAAPIPPKNLRLAAEFFYDFGLPEQAAELFSRFPGDPQSIARQADALWLSGRGEAARSLWAVLAGTGRDDVNPKTLQRCLYNLALGAEDRAEKTVWFERLLAGDAKGLYGTIGYSRLMDDRRAIAFLESSGLPEREGLADLELLRRRQAVWPVDRIVPETWLLLGRHPEDQALYQWGACFFDRQRHYGETAQLLRIAEHRGFSDPWIALHKALGCILEGKLEEGETLLRGIDGENALWQIPANIGRVLEARRSPAEALEYYETAAARVGGREDAAKIQLRIARCLRALGREQESRRSLEYGLSLDGENLRIRLELERLGW